MKKDQRALRSKLERAIEAYYRVLSQPNQTPDEVKRMSEIVQHLLKEYRALDPQDDSQSGKKNTHKQ